MATTTAERFEPTLCGLPAKLKQRILSYLDVAAFYADLDDWESDDWESDDEEDAEKKEAEEGAKKQDDNDDDVVVSAELLDDPEDQRKLTLGALSLVNKAWHELVAPLFWHDLYLWPASTEELLHLVRDILPRVGQHVEKLSLRETAFDPLLEHGDLDNLPPAEGTALTVVEAAEKLGGVDASLADWELRTLRARNLVLAQIVKACPAVKQLDFQGFVRPMKIKPAGEEDTVIIVEQVEVPNVALEAIKARGTAIEALSLLLPPDGLTTETDVAALLRAFPDLVHLDINCFLFEADEAKRAAARSELVDALEALTKLEELDLGESTFVNDAFAARAFTWPLKHLALGEYAELSFGSFVTLVERFSATLVSLELDGTPHDDSEDDTAAYLGKALNLPHLTALEVATPHKTAFLDAFAQCPLEEVLLGDCPQFTVAEVLKFLEAHKATLKALDYEDDGIPDEEKEGAEDAEGSSTLERLADWCEENSVEFALIPGHDDCDTCGGSSDDENEYEALAEDEKKDE
ncbi:hypothetical protein JCM10207_006967 [Rhodosporidiobolus poonsookiae]